MKILLTGSTAVQVGSSRTRLNIVTAAASWYAVLQDIGHEVEWRVVTPGENLACYDRIVVILNKPNSLASSYAYGALWSLRQAGDRAIVALDDYQTQELLGGLQTYARSRKRAFGLHGGNLHEVIQDGLFETMNALAFNSWKFPVVAPILGKSNLSLLGLSAARVIGVDPTAYARRYVAKPIARRRKVWVQASLAPHELPNVDWPVETYGPTGFPRVSEETLAEIYAGVWGVVSPAHPHAGSGWWRVRYLMASDSGCVLTATEAEAKGIGQSYLDAVDPRVVERLTNVDRKHLAATQTAELTRLIWPRAKVKKVWNELVARV